MDVVDAALKEYVADLVKRGDATSEPIVEAFRTVRRHRFLSGWYRLETTGLEVAFRKVPFDRDHATSDQLKEIYSNRALVTSIDGGLPSSSTSQPALIARMLGALELEPGMRVLEIGTGTGYNAALLAEIVGRSGQVCTVDMQEDVAGSAMESLRNEGYRHVRVWRRDGYLGVPEAAPFDRIVATVGCSDLSPRWIEQLSPEGFLLVPVRHGVYDPLVVARPDPEDASSAAGRVVGRSGFMPIQGRLGWVDPWTSLIARMPSTPLWSRPLPQGLPPPDRGTAVRDDPRHWAFYFFLTLASRDLWITRSGYGLADLGTESTVVVTDHSIDGFSATGHARSLENLHERLLYLLELWEELGRVGPEAYALRFVPRAHLAHAVGGALRTWVIERPFFCEIVRLPNVD